MTEFQPWTITGGTLQLNPWPAHTGRVVVTVDVFEPHEVTVVDLEGDTVCHTLPPGVGSHDTDPWDYDDVLADLFAHIDANPQATYHLRTLHPERVREAWPCRRDTDGDGDCPACSRDPSSGCKHRQNVAIAAGPIRTQNDADRLLPELLQLSDLCREVYPVFRPVERIQLPLPCRDSVFWSAFPRIVVSGGPEPMDVDGIRSLRDQAVERGVRFVLQWGTWKPPLEITWRPSCPALDPPNNSLDTVPWPWESEVEA